MITITVTIELYTYSELCEEAQNKAVNDIIKAWTVDPMFVPDDAKEGYDMAVIDSERMQTPWFVGEYIWDYCKKQVLEQLGEWYFTKDGTFNRWIEE